MAKRRELKQTIGYLDDKQFELLKAQLKVSSFRLRHHNRMMQAKKRQYNEMTLREAHSRGDTAEVHRISRLMSNKRIAVRKRDYRSLPSFRPAISDWSDFLARPGTEGGLSAVQLKKAT